jgi:hypothetical protein
MRLEMLSTCLASLTLPGQGGYRCRVREVAGVAAVAPKQDAPTMIIVT